jgi:DNA polymerase-3 subunit gamma/tau
MSYLVLARKWRPQRFEDMVGQQHVSLTLSNALRTGRISHAYLFAGPRGVGKTSMARILAKALNCEKGPIAEPCNQCPACVSITDGHCLDVLEIDGASNRGIDDVRQLRESVKYAPASMRTKVYIIDEVHMLTADAFNALLKTLEEPPRHVCFMMATTEPLKVPATILSRCQRFDFGRLTADELVGNLKRIVAAEGMKVGDDGLRLLARKAEGSVRDSLTLLDQLAATGEGPFGAEDVQRILGLSGTALYFDVSAAVIAGDVAAALRCLHSAYQEGLNLQEVADELVHHFRDLLLVCLDEGLDSVLDETADERARLLEQAKPVRPADALRWLRILLDAAARMRRSAHGRVHLEIALAEMASLPRAVDLAAVLAALKGASAVPGISQADSPLAGSKGASAGNPKSQSPSPAASSAEPAPGGGSGTARDLSLEEAWQGVCGRVQSERAFLGSCLHGSRATSITDGRIQVTLDDTNGFKCEQVDRPANRRFIQQAIEEIFGRPLGFRLISAAQARPKEVRDADASPAGSPRAGADHKRPAPRSPTESDPEFGAAKVRRIARLVDGDIIGPSR